MSVSVDLSKDKDADYYLEAPAQPEQRELHSPCPSDPTEEFALLVLSSNIFVNVGRLSDPLLFTNRDAFSKASLMKLKIK